MKLGKIFSWLFIVYFLLFIFVFLASYTYHEFVPPTSEFDGMWLVVYFFPFFALYGFFNEFLTSDSSVYLSGVILFLFSILLMIGVLKIKPIRVVLSVLGVVLLLSLIYFIPKMDFIDSMKPITQSDEIFALGGKAAMDKDYSLCASKIPSHMLSSTEKCLEIAALFSGDGKFCDDVRDNDYCLDDMKTADSFVRLKCKDGQNRADCLNNYCFESGDSSSWNITYCIKDIAEESVDGGLCEEIYGKTNESDRSDCLNYFKADREPIYVIDENGQVIEK